MTVIIKQVPDFSDEGRMSLKTRMNLVFFAKVVDACNSNQTTEKLKIAVSNVFSNKISYRQLDSWDYGWKKEGLSVTYNGWECLFVPCDTECIFDDESLDCYER